MDTLGEFVWTVGQSEYPFPTSATPARLRLIARFRDFAKSIGCSGKAHQASHNAMGEALSPSAVEHVH